MPTGPPSAREAVRYTRRAVLCVGAIAIALGRFPPRPLSAGAPFAPGERSASRATTTALARSEPHRIETHLAVLYKERETAITATGRTGRDAWTAATAAARSAIEASTSTASAASPRLPMSRKGPHVRTPAAVRVGVPVACDRCAQGGGRPDLPHSTLPRRLTGAPETTFYPAKRLPTLPQLAALASASPRRVIDEGLTWRPSDPRRSTALGKLAREFGTGTPALGAGCAHSARLTGSPHAPRRRGEHDIV